MQKNKGIIHIFIIVLGIVIILFLMGFFTSQKNIDSTVNTLDVKI